jgi:hypothetical protein
MGGIPPIRLQIQKFKQEWNAGFTQSAKMYGKVGVKFSNLQHIFDVVFFGGLRIERLSKLSIKVLNFCKTKELGPWEGRKSLRSIYMEGEARQEKSTKQNPIRFRLKKVDLAY